MVHAIIKKDEEIKAFSMQPISYYKTVDRNICSLKDALTRPSITLGELKRECPDKIEGLIVKCVEAMLKYHGFDARSEMSVCDLQVHELANDIMGKYFYFTINDLALVFKKARQNPRVYGTFYGRFDASLVMKWFSIYDRERDDIMPSIPEESFKVQPTGFECSREDYIEMLEAMVAGGDLYANEMLRKVGCFETLMRRNKGSFFVYQYNRKHRLDEPMKKGGRR